MAWSPERKRFLGALALFLIWVAMLAALAVVSSRGPAERGSTFVAPVAPVAPASTPAEK